MVSALRQLRERLLSAYEHLSAREKQLVLLLGGIFGIFALGGILFAFGQTLDSRTKQIRIVSKQMEEIRSLRQDYAAVKEKEERQRA